MTVMQKEAHRAMWAAGDYPSIAHEIVAPLGERLVEAVQILDRERVLDVAAGNGNAAVAASRRGARVVATDLTPELLESGRGLHAEPIDWIRADAEDLPFLDGDFDVVLSCIGVMFTPFHRSSAAELLRVCRPGGRIGLLSWTPGGFIGQMFAIMRPYAAPAPDGASPPPLWGDPAHVRTLLGHAVEGLHAITGSLRVDRFANRPAHAFRDYFKARYGPTIVTYRRLADRPDDVAALDAAIDDLVETHRASDGSMAWEYLLTTARRARPAESGED